MTSTSPGRLICAALDPVLVPAGFTAGQGDLEGVSEDGRTEIIFCAAHDELSASHPGLPQAHAQERDRNACVDLVVDVGSDGRLESLDLEGLPLAATLRLVGLDDDADSLQQTREQPLVGALAILADVLRRLLGATVAT